MSPAQLGVLVPIIFFLGLFAMIFGIIYLRNKERMAMIERGMELNNNLPKKRQSNTSYNLTIGLLMVGSGLGLFIAYMVNHFALSDEENPAIFLSLIAFFGGLGLLISYFIENKMSQKKEL